MKRFTSKTTFIVAAIMAICISGGLTASSVFADDNPRRPRNLDGYMEFGKAVIDWDAPSGGASVDGYQILRRHVGPQGSGISNILVDYTESTDTEYEDTTVVPGNTYVHRVKARNGDNLSIWSSWWADYQPNTPAWVENVSKGLLDICGVNFCISAGGFIANESTTGGGSSFNFTGVEIKSTCYDTFSEAEREYLTVAIHEVTKDSNERDVPGTILHSLTYNDDKKRTVWEKHGGNFEGCAKWDDYRVATFDAPDDASLDPNTTCFIRMAMTGGTASFEPFNQESDSEYQSHNDDWRIANTSTYKAGTGFSTIYGEGLVLPFSILGRDAYSLKPKPKPGKGKPPQRVTPTPIPEDTEVAMVKSSLGSRAYTSYTTGAYQGFTTGHGQEGWPLDKIEVDLQRGLASDNTPEVRIYPSVNGRCGKGCTKPGSLIWSPETTDSLTARGIKTFTPASA